MFWLIFVLIFVVVLVFVVTGTVGRFAQTSHFADGLGDCEPTLSVFGADHGDALRNATLKTFEEFHGLIYLTTFKCLNCDP